MFSEVDRAWAAGFFDGEGYIGILANKNTSPRARFLYKQPQLMISQMRREPLDRFQSIMGVGKVYYNGGIFQYCCFTWRSIYYVVKMMWPYLSTPKKEQAREVVRKYKAREIQHVF